MNVKLLRKVKRHILAEPKRLDMGDYIQRGNPKTDKSLPKCGTVGCIAGWACLLSHGMTFRGDAYKEATRLLDLSQKQAWNLFMRKLYCHSTAEDAQEIAEHIEHFIKTGE